MRRNWSPNYENRQLEEREGYLWEHVLSPAGEPVRQYSPRLQDFDHSVLNNFTDRIPEGKMKKYFTEFQTTNNVTFFHRDSRFFKNITDEYLTKNVQVLFAAFVRFAKSENIPYWISHGALIGWFWNGRILPWDDDVDVQTSVVGFLKLVELNQTVFEGRYYLDVNPYALGARHVDWKLHRLQVIHLFECHIVEICYFSIHSFPVHLIFSLC